MKGSRSLITIWFDCTRKSGRLSHISRRAHCSIEGRDKRHFSGGAESMAMRTMAISGFVLAALGAASAAAFARVEAKGAIQQKLAAEYQLTKTTDDRSDIVTAGSVLVLQKDNLLMMAVSTADPCMNTYKEGQITQGRMCRLLERGRHTPFPMPHADSAP